MSVSVKIASALIVCVLALPARGFSQELSAPVLAEFPFEENADVTWGKVLASARQSSFFVTAIDSQAMLVSGMLALDYVTSSDLILPEDAVSGKRGAAVAQVTIRARRGSSMTVLSVRAWFFREDSILFSNGKLERQVATAVQQGKSFSSVTFESSGRRYTLAQGASQIQALAKLESQDCPGAPNVGRRLVRSVFSVPSNVVGSVVAGGASGYHSANGFLSIWIDDGPSGTNVDVGVFFIELARYSPPVLLSNGTTEDVVGMLLGVKSAEGLKTSSELLTRAGGRAAGGVAHAQEGGGASSLWRLIECSGKEKLSDRGTAAREFPERAAATWEAALQVLVQSPIIPLRVSNDERRLDWLSLIPRDDALDYPAYGRLEVGDTRFGSQLFVEIEAVFDRAADFAAAELDLAGKIATQLRVTHGVDWLIQKASPDAPTTPAR
jgi:hypothetical protein